MIRIMTVELINPYIRHVEHSTWYLGRSKVVASDLKVVGD